MEILEAPQTNGFGAEISAKIQDNVTCRVEKVDRRHWHFFRFESHNCPNFQYTMSIVQQNDTMMWYDTVWINMIFYNTTIQPIQHKSMEYILLISWKGVAAVSKTGAMFPSFAKPHPKSLWHCTEFAEIRKRGPFLLSFRAELQGYDTHFPYAWEAWEIKIFSERWLCLQYGAL